MFIVDSVLKLVNDAIDKIFPDATVAAQLKAQVATQALEWYKAEAADRDSARKREVDAHDNTPKQLAWMYTIGYFIMMIVVAGGYLHVPENMTSLFNGLLGVLTAGQYTVMTYYFGSSSGSTTKDKTLDRVVNHRD